MIFFLSLFLLSVSLLNAGYCTVEEMEKSVKTILEKNNSTVERDQEICSIICNEYRERNFRNAAYYTFISASTAGMERALYAVRDALTLRKLQSPDTVVVIDDIIEKSNEDAVQPLLDLEHAVERKHSQVSYDQGEVSLIVTSIESYYKNGYDLWSYRNELPENIEEEWAKYKAITVPNAETIITIFELFDKYCSQRNIALKNDCKEDFIRAERIFNIFKRRLFFSSDENKDNNGNQKSWIGGTPPIPEDESVYSPLSLKCSVKRFFYWKDKKKESIVLTTDLLRDLIKSVLELNCINSLIIQYISHPKATDQLKNIKEIIEKSVIRSFSESFRNKALKIHSQEKIDEIKNELKNICERSLKDKERRPLGFLTGSKTSKFIKKAFFSDTLQTAPSRANTCPNENFTKIEAVLNSVKNGALISFTEDNELNLTEIDNNFIEYLKRGLPCTVLMNERGNCCVRVEDDVSCVLASPFAIVKHLHKSIGPDNQSVMKEYLEHEKSKNKIIRKPEQNVSKHKNNRSRNKGR